MACRRRFLAVLGAGLGALVAFYTLGGTADRNTVIDADFSGLRPAHSPAAPPPAHPAHQGAAAGSAGQTRPNLTPTGPGKGLPATGGVPIAVPAAAALAAAAIGHRLNRRTAGG